MDVKEQKKADASNRLAFETHVGILMRIQGLSKPIATARAYMAGPSGLNALITPVSAASNPPAK